MPRVYKPRGSPKSSTMRRRKDVDSRRAASRSAVYADKRYVKNAYSRRAVLGVESKFFDSAVSATAINAATDAAGLEMDPATLLCLNAVPQGDTASSRDGFKIAMKSLQIDGVIDIPKQATGGGDNPTIIDVFVVLDTQTNAAQLNSEDVYTNNIGSFIGSACMKRNMSYTERFKVLKHKQITITPPPISYTGAAVLQSGVQRPFSAFIKLGGLQTKYQAGTTTGYVGTIVDNSLHLIAVITAGDLAATMNYSARLRYVG